MHTYITTQNISLVQTHHTYNTPTDAWGTTEGEQAAAEGAGGKD
jgi:hypothetical protein